MMYLKHDENNNVFFPRIHKKTRICGDIYRNNVAKIWSACLNFSSRAWLGQLFHPNLKNFAGKRHVRAPCRGKGTNIN